VLSIGHLYVCWFPGVSRDMCWTFGFVMDWAWLYPCFSSNLASYMFT
jgi:hypothetical protein